MKMYVGSDVKNEMIKHVANFEDRETERFNLIYEETSLGGHADGIS